MGEAFITRRGGGIPYAVIGVTYPSGSVCTCTNGTRTITAKDTSGKALFVIPAAGTWTVKAVKGSQSASKAVSITAEGQVATVTLAYDYIIFSNATGLNSVYSDGGGGAPVEIGTDSSGKKILTFNENLIHFSLDLIDQVVVHELCHDFYQNHSKQFYDKLSLYCPDYKLRKEKLIYGIRK